MYSLFGKGNILDGIYYSNLSECLGGVILLVLMSSITCADIGGLPTLLKKPGMYLGVVTSPSTGSIEIFSSGISH